MSEDDFSDPYDEPSMEISIETLTGTSFDVRVYPTDTILDIKNKIDRVEGGLVLMNECFLVYIIKLKFISSDGLYDIRVEN